MIIITAICIIVSGVIGLFVGKIFFSKKHSIASDSAQTSSDEAITNAEKKVTEIKNKYEALLSESNKKIQALDEQLKLALAGKTDESIKIQLSEIDKLKKKIKDLEDENEDFEDSLDSYKKKLKSKEDYLSSLQTNFDKLIREKKQLQNDLQSVSIELDNKAKELELKMESLHFVQEILSAKKISDTSVTNIHAKIDNLKEFISSELKETVLSIYNLGVDTTNYIFENGLASWAITAKKNWIQGKTSIAFVGEFSAGKTSIVNRILSQNNPNIPLLPVSTKATTAIPTYISGGVGTMYQFVTPNNDIKSISESTFKRVNKEVLEQVQGISSLIQYFVMTYKNPNLDRLSILDTPGFNSNDKEDAERTIGVINECDALFWVFDVNNGTVNRSSINLIKEHLTKPLYVVINKVDTKAKSEVDKVETLIRKTLSDAGQSVEGFIRFSQTSPLEDIMTPIKSIKHDVNKESYIQTLIDAVAEWTSDQEKDVISAKKNADSLLRKCNSITNQYNSAVNKMSTDCESVANIPQYNPQHGFLNFNAPNYDMSQSEYSRMINLLNNIQGPHLNSLCNLYNKMHETTGELENAWNQHAEEREKWQRLNNCLETLNNKVKNLKNK